MSMKSRTTAKPNPLQKKITPNPKFKDVRPVVDSGASVNRYMRRLAEISQNYRYRKDEIFKRLKISTFAQLVLQVSDLERDANDLRLLEAEPELDGAIDNDVELDADLSSVNRDGDASQRTVVQENGAANQSNGNDNGLNDSSRSRSSMQSVISGMGELDLKRNQGSSAGGRGAHRNHNATSDTWWKIEEEPAGDRDGADSRRSAMTDENRNEASSRSTKSNLPIANSPYLLLDVRDRDEYDAAHIRTAISYPTAMLSRSVNAELPEMRAYRNEPGRIVIVYDTDESIAPRVATTLVQRGYDNLFILSGGLRVARKVFPEGLVVERAGDDPASSEFDAEAVDKVRAALETHMVRGGASSSSRANSRTSAASSASSRASTRSTVTSVAPSRQSTASSASTMRPAFK